jgi:bifunctional non-homologous end joining protein LigD
MVVEGEIFYPKKKSNTVTGIMGCDPWKALMRQGFGEFSRELSPETLYWRLDPSEEWRDVNKVDKDFAKFADLGKIHYCLFEMTYLNGEDLRNLPWEERREKLEAWYEEHVEGTEHATYIHLSDVFEGDNAKRKLLEWAEANQEEGIVFKNRKSTYQCDKRPEHHWYRKKGKIYADVVVMGYLPPEREYKGKASELANWQYWESEDGRKLHADNQAGALQQAKELGMSAITPVTKFYFYNWIGSIVFGLYKDGELVEAGSSSGMDEAIRKEFTLNQEQFIGKVVEISAMERTDKGKFRHPNFERFRDDKNVEDCLWENEMEE